MYLNKIKIDLQVNLSQKYFKIKNKFKVVRIENKLIKKKILIDKKICQKKPGKNGKISKTKTVESTTIIKNNKINRQPFMKF